MLWKILMKSNKNKSKLKNKIGRNKKRLMYVL